MDGLTYYQEDCMNSDKYIEKNSVDLFFVDSPYYISGNKSKTSKTSKIQSSLRSNWDRQWDSKEEFYDWTKQWMELMFSQLKNEGSAYICISWEHSGEFKNILENCGFIIRSRITWKRDKGRGSKKNWKSIHEDIWFVTKSNTYTFNIEDVMVEKEVIAPYRDENGQPKDWFLKDGKPFRYTYPSNLWLEFTVPFWSMKEVRSYALTKKSPNNILKKHSTQKPKDLVKKCIKASSNIGDTVVDYFGGSGTTAIAALELKRKTVIFDKSPECIEMLETRILNELIEDLSPPLFE